MLVYNLQILAFVFYLLNSISNVMCVQGYIYIYYVMFWLRMSHDQQVYQCCCWFIIICFLLFIHRMFVDYLHTFDRNGLRLKTYRFNSTLFTGPGTYIYIIIYNKNMHLCTMHAWPRIYKYIINPTYTYLSMHNTRVI